MAVLYLNPCYSEVCYNEVVLYLLFAYAQTMVKISCVVTPQLVNAFVFPTKIVQSLYFRNLKPLTIFCSCTAEFGHTWLESPKQVFLQLGSYDLVKIQT